MSTVGDSEADPELALASDPLVYEQQFAVRFRYQVIFTADLFSVKNSVFVDVISPAMQSSMARFALFLDEGLTRARPKLASEIDEYVSKHAERLELVGQALVVPGGELAKNNARLVEEFHAAISQLRLDRHSYLVAIGGGAVLDTVGYVAATAHRGIRHVRIPSTTLAQGDSGVGVKNGINAFGRKNFLGTFAPPFAVINDISLLRSLPKRHSRSGLAEVVKVASIRDRSFFDWLEANADLLRDLEFSTLTRAIQRSAELHLAQISGGGDPFETGTARPLDYGHWAAHKLEMMSNFSVLHGEAVAVGMALDTRYCVESGCLDEGEGMRVLDLLRNLGFSLWHPALEQVGANGRAEVLDGVTEFQEHMGGQLTIIMLRSIGSMFEVNELDEEKIQAALRYLKETT